MKSFLAFMRDLLDRGYDGMVEENMLRIAESDSSHLSVSDDSHSHTLSKGVNEQRYYEDDLPSHLYDSEAVQWFLVNGLDEKLLHNSAIRAAWHHVVRWYEEYGTAPDRTYLRSEYPMLEVGEPTWTRAGLLEALKQRYRRNHFEDGIRRAVALAGNTSEWTPERLQGAKDYLRSWLEDDIGDVLKPLVFYTGPQLRDIAEAELEWIAYPFVIDEGSRTLFQGLAKAGKTTYLLHLAEAVVLGRAFLGRPTVKMPVVYLTEQIRGIFARQCPKALLWSDDFRVIPYPENYELSWPDFVNHGVDQCTQIGSRLLIIDTANKFAQLEGDTNNSDGHVRAALRETDRALNQGVSVILAKHSRKSEGHINSAAGGSIAWSAEADIIVDIRISGELEKNERRLQTSGRLQEGLGEWIVSYDPVEDAVSLLGAADDVTKNATVEALREVLADGEAHSLKDIQERTGLQKTTLANALKRNSDQFEKVDKGFYRSK